MHPSVMAYVAGMVDKIGPFTRVLDVGSYDDKGDAETGNGSVRRLFPDSKYIGVDVREGPGVDRVMSSHNLLFPAGSFDLVVSTEMLEHDTRPWESVEEMARVLDPEGALVLTARGFDGRGCYEVHGTPDLWRFSVDGLALMVNRVGLQVIDSRADPDEPGVFLTAVRP